MYVEYSVAFWPRTLHIRTRLACAHYVRPTAMTCGICGKEKHNSRTCKALSEAQSEVALKRHELALAETALTQIEEKWRIYQMKKTPNDAKRSTNTERGEKKDFPQNEKGVVINVNTIIDSRKI